MIPSTFRNRVPQVFTYTFLDQNQQNINLTNYITAVMEVSKKGIQGFTTYTASIIAPSQVQGESWTPTIPGFYFVQFYVADIDGNRLYGAPFGFQVEANLDDQ